MTDEQGRQTLYRYKAYGSPDEARLAWVRLPGQPEPTADQYSYSEDGRLLNITYEGSEQSIQYNQLKLMTMENTGADIRYFGYDLAGNLRCRGNNPACSDYSVTNSAAEVRYTLDGLGRTTRIDYSGAETPAVSYDYRSADGLLEQVTDGAGEHRFQYYSSGRVQATISEIGGVAFETQYEFDGRGNLEAVIYPSGRRVDYTYDSGNRLKTINGFVTNIDYHPSGLASTITYPNGKVMTLTLDTRRRPDRLTVPGVMSHDYNFSAAGNLSAISNTLGTSVGLTYDSLDRLETASGAWGSLEYSYDALGNRLLRRLNGIEVTQEYFHGEPVPIGDPARLIYDHVPSGNVVTKAAGSENHQFEYDREDRLIRVWRLFPNLTRNLEAEYVYDSKGRRARQTIGSGCGATRLFHYSLDGSLLAETSTSGIVLKEYVVASGRTFAEIELTAVDAQPSQVGFSEIEVGSSASAVVTVTNHTNSPVPLVIEGNGTLHFRLAGPVPSQLAPGQSELVTVEYLPVSAGAHYATFAFCAAGVRVQIAAAGSARNPRPISPISYLHDGPIDPNSVNATNFHVYGELSGYVAGTTQVNGNEVIFTPVKHLSAGEELTFSSTGWSYSNGIPSPPFVRRGRVPSVAGNMSFNYLPVVAPVSGVNYESARAGDLNGDGYVDLFVGRFDYSATPERREIAVWLNDRLGSFTAGPVLDLPGARGNLAADVNGDGSLDLLLLGPAGSAAELTIHIADGAGGFAGGLPATYPEINPLEYFDLGDLDADGDQDLVFGGQNGSARAVLVLLNDGSGNYSRGEFHTLATGLSSLKMADLDRDGDLDLLALAYGYSSSSSRLYNNGSAQFAPASLDALNGELISMGDLSGDGVTDALVFGTSLSSVKLGQLQNGVIQFFSTPGWPLFSAMGTPFLGDLDADGDLDAVAAEWTSTRLFPNDGSGNLASGSTWIGSPMSLADFNGDGAVDILLLSQAEGLRIGQNL